MSARAYPEYPDDLKVSVWEKDKRSGFDAKSDMADKLKALQKRHDAVDWKLFAEGWARAARTATELEAEGSKRDSAHRSSVQPPAVRLAAIGSASDKRYSLEAPARPHDRTTNPSSTFEPIAMEKHLDFFLFLGSTYTYLAVNRAEQVAARGGVALRWRPFSVRSIMIEQNNRPFVGKPVKLSYMWRDLERRAQRHGIPFGSIPNYPNDPDELASRVATLAAIEGWCSQFAKAAYALWFMENKDPGKTEHLFPLIESLGKNPHDVVSRADGQDVRDKYAAETELARFLGIFGSPTFVCGDEIFWGDDRLEDAVDWCMSH